MCLGYVLAFSNQGNKWNVFPKTNDNIQHYISSDNINNMIMPYLVNGHMRFTEEDDIIIDFQKNIKEKYKVNSYNSLVNLLNIENNILETMKYEEILNLFNTEKNIKTSLKKSLEIIIAIAEKEGYTLNELMQ